MANMFRCVLASGGGALILTVTCDSVFAGQTITCTDGTTTLTQICPSTSPYTVEFRIPNGGTWTISSGTDSTSVVIPDAIELHYLPNGSTVTPTDDIQIWLHCAEIWDKDYTTVSQVLSDSSTLQALIASSNAADYMARSTTWASSVTADSSAMTYIGLNDYCANVLLNNLTWLSAICNSTYFESVLGIKVPTMTSNTSPSGTVTASNDVADSGLGGRPYHAFDNNDNTVWLSSTSTSEYIGYQFTSPMKLSLVTLKGTENVSGKEAKYYVQGYNGSSWVNLSSEQTYTIAMGIQKTVQKVPIIASQKYTKYRLQFTTQIRQASVGAMYPIQIQYYGRA